MHGLTLESSPLPEPGAVPGLAYSRPSRSSFQARNLV
jgi:hypothetical protein